MQHCLQMGGRAQMVRNSCKWSEMVPDEPNILEQDLNSLRPSWSMLRQQSQGFLWEVFGIKV